MSDIVNIVNTLRSYNSEREWFEFKENWFRAKALGEYISAISNSAAIEGKKNGYFVWGINDITHEITGTNFDYNQDVNNEPLKHYLARSLNPSINLIFEECFIDGKRVVLLTIPAAKLIPTAFENERYIRIGSSKEKIRKFPQQEI